MLRPSIFLFFIKNCYLCIKKIIASIILVKKGGNMKTFLLKAKHFFKRNIYPITVSVCTILVLSIISISAYSAIKNSGEQTVIETANDTIPTEQISDEKNNGKINESENEVSQTDSAQTIIFELPFENATISKAYSDSSLQYDATTKLWCTHQGVDFACSDGQEVVAVYDGVIEKIENSMMNGTTIYLKVSDELVVVYKGLSSNVDVKEGESVKKGAKLGKVTSFLAEKADGVHLHLELLKAKKLIDPTDYFSLNK